MLRLKAIFDCLYFGLVPYWVYEEESHYGSSFEDYLDHMRVNARVAKSWVTFQESEGQVRLAKTKAKYFR